MVRVEAGAYLAERKEASDQQRRTDRQHHGQRHLSSHQARLRLIVPQASAATVAALSQRTAQVRTRRAESGHESEYRAGQKRQAQGESQNTPVEAYIGAPQTDARDVVGDEGQNGADADVACRQTQNPAGER